METLSTKDYLRERLEPKPGDFHYLCFSDLLIAIKSFMPTEASRVLDGSHTARPLFGDCIYHRADLTGGSDLDSHCLDLIPTGLNPHITNSPTYGRASSKVEL